MSARLCPDCQVRKDVRFVHFTDFQIARHVRLSDCKTCQIVRLQDLSDCQIAKRVRLSDCKTCQIARLQNVSDSQIARSVRLQDWDGWGEGWATAGRPIDPSGFCNLAARLPFAIRGQVKNSPSCDGVRWCGWVLS